ncbi:MAG: PD-(D/E)XK nuclease family protein [Armatimonadota bacterium]
MSHPLLTTYTFWRTFQTCRKACQWRYLEGLIPIGRDHALTLGSVVHQGLECWHRHGDITQVLTTLDEACQTRQQLAEMHTARLMASAMLTGYVLRYPVEEFTVVALERVLQGPIVNPVTGMPSRRFFLAGKIDGLVQWNGEYFLLEHKTTSSLDGNYLERLWTDQQITLYTMLLEQIQGIRITGILYNILVKAKLQQGLGETETEFQARRVALLAKSKTGKSSAQRRLPESDADFQARLQAKYADPTLYHREVLYLSRDQRAAAMADLWDLTQQCGEAQRRRLFARTTAQCFPLGRSCPYVPLCRADGAAHIKALLYEMRPPHEELLDEFSQTMPPLTTALDV